MNTLQAHAARALDHGLCVLPAATDGTKRPAFPWSIYQQQPPTERDIQSWFDDTHPVYDGLGYVCGQISGNLEMLEIEGRAAHLYDQLLETAAATGLDFVLRIDAGYTEISPSGGIHWLYRSTGPVDGNLKLARRTTVHHDQHTDQDYSATVEVLIETRGEGGWTVAAPSAGRTHPTGQPWRILHGDIATIATISAEQRQQLLDLCRTFDQMPAREQVVLAAVPVPSTHPLDRTFAVDRPGDLYNRQTSWNDILEPQGWTLVYQRDGVGYWRRPGKHEGISATTNALGTDRLKVFTSSTIFDTEGTYDKLGAHALLHHQGNLVEAVRSIAPPQPERPVNQLLPAHSQPVISATEDDSDDEDDEDSWTPIDLAPYLDGTSKPIIPTIGEVEGGKCLFYLGRTSTIFGASGDGKTWIAYAVTAQILNTDRHTIWCDLEDSPEGTIERLRQLGVEDRRIRQQFHYLHPDEPLTQTGRHKISRLAVDATLAIIDSTGESVALEGLNPDKDQEVATWGRRFPRWLANQGPAVVLIDHIAKSRDRDPLFAIGTQRKRAMIDGAAYLAEMVVEFGRGRTGRTKLTTAKDRGGHHQRRQPAAMFILDATTTPYGYKLEAVPETDPKEDARVKAQHDRETVSQHIVDHPGITKSKLKDDGGKIGLSRTDLFDALDWLIVEGYVEALKGGQGGAVRHMCARPYNALIDGVMFRQDEAKK